MYYDVVLYGMVWYGMLVWYAMLEWYDVSMLWYVRLWYVILVGRVS